MKRRSREINIFSMSALDLFAGAMGAFIILAVISLPYFGNTHRISDEELIAEAEAAREEARAQTEERERVELELAECRVQHDRVESELEICRRNIKSNFLLVLMSWDTRGVDVDLHVTDPEGREFYFPEASRTHVGSAARLEEDNTVGPGNEIWLHPQVTPGEYVIEYNLYRGGRGAVSVRGSVFNNDGRIMLPDVVLRTQGRKVRVARVRVDGNAEISLVD